VGRQYSGTYGTAVLQAPTQATGQAGNQPVASSVASSLSGCTAPAVLRALVRRTVALGVSRRDSPAFTRSGRGGQLVGQRGESIQNGVDPTRKILQRCGIFGEAGDLPACNAPRFPPHNARAVSAAAARPPCPGSCRAAPWRRSVPSQSRPQSAPASLSRPLFSVRSARLFASGPRLFRGCRCRSHCRSSPCPWLPFTVTGLGRDLPAAASSPACSRAVPGTQR
jgi:hypothetical protein